MSRHFVEFIQNHADQMTARLIARIRSHRTSIGLRKYDDLELGRRARDSHSHRGFWLRTSSETEVERTFREFGAAERRRGTPAADIGGVLVLTCRNLFECVETEVEDSISTCGRRSIS